MVDKRALPRNLAKFLALQDFIDHARGVLPRPIYGYVTGGVEDNVSLRGNRNVFDEVGFVPKVLVDTTARTQKTQLFGRTYNAPFGFAPMGGTSTACYRGDTVLASVAAEANIPMMMSGASLMKMEDVKAAGRTAMFQAYLPGDEERIQKTFERCEKAGFDTIAVTVDVQVPANRENNVRNGYSTPLRPSLRLAWDVAVRPKWLFGMFLKTLMTDGMPHVENMGPRVPMLASHSSRDYGRRDRLSWKHIEFMRKIWKGNLLIKGVVDKESVRIAREHGLNGVMVSNHGGRQLDGTIAPARALPGIREAAGKEMTVIMDSGFRRGTDILKALALGADFCFVGRPFLCAAACAGAPGVTHAVSLLMDEIDRNMAQLGLNNPKEITKDFLMPMSGAEFLTQAQ
ncbi:MAG: alpha-hydroxy-acid oxidizing protein [Betaproteobacteria bacterium]|nr:alpha-hydroxy-acid oxidizing protein [Betaproteobacteria bacterium]